ncbi:MAG: 4Fe-4S cluster-binding domain-containing protein [Verrucomicrobia bacterium]|nr:4Fe-4S cluster-binding domain-containing protein [Verrucomicrobiota bacterium]
MNRLAGEQGLCHAGAETRFFSAQVEVSDELELIPTFAVALSGCDLRCDFCITGGPSWNARAGDGFDSRTMAMRAIQALDQGARTVMVLGGEPTIHLPAVLEFVAEMPDTARLIWKTNTHGSAQARELLDGMFDVWLADFKFGNDECAFRLAKVPNYLRIVKENLLWMAGKPPDAGVVQESGSFQSTLGRPANLNDSPSPLPAPAGRGRIVRRLTQEPASGFTGRSSATQRTDNICSLSQRERVRVRENTALIQGRDHNSFEVTPDPSRSTLKYELTFAPPVLIVRHLLMPGHVDCCWRPVAEWLAAELPGVKVNLRSGFWPAWHAARHRDFCRPITKAESDWAMRVANAHKLNLIP